MKTLLVSEVFPPKVGGSGRWLWDIFSRLPRNQVIIAAGDCPGADEFDRSHDLQVVRIPLKFETWGILGFRAARQYWRRFREIYQLAKKERVRTVFAGRILPEGLLALALHWRTGLPYTCFVYGEELNSSAESRELTFLVRKILARADRVISCSQNTIQLIINEWGIPPEKAHLLYPGVDTQVYVSKPRDFEVRAELKWGNRPVVLTVGRLQKRKGQDTMIRALPAIRARIPDVLYAIVGEGDERPHLEALAKELGVKDSVEFLGEIPNDRMLHCLQQCDLFTLPNRQVGSDIEGFGIVLLEAQACGKAVIAGMSGGTAETMSIPDTGAVIDCTTPEHLTDVVVEWLRDPARLARMGRAARDWVVSRFDWTVVGEQANRLLLASSNV